MNEGGRIDATERIELLDILRGFAILGILFVNMPTMAGYSTLPFADPRLLGWSTVDEWAFSANFLIEGTLRGLLQILFGAGMMVALRHSMSATGPVGPLDAYARRNLCLVIFGAFHALVLWWPGDILFIYGLAALLLPPFRALKPRKQFRIGVNVTIVAILVTCGTFYWQERTQAAALTTAQATRTAARPMSDADKVAIQQAERRAEVYAPEVSAVEARAMDAERRIHRGSIIDHAQFNIEQWVKYLFGDGWLALGLAESFGAMLIGAALYGWGILGGRASSTFYWRLLLVCYAIGFGARALALDHFLAFDPTLANPGRLVADTLGQFARLIIAVGHIAAIALIARSRFVSLVRPLAANGKMPLTTYLGASLVIHDLLMPGYAGDQWGRYSFASQMLIALAFMTCQCIGANWWLRSGFATGPAEWLWKSLAYGKRQPWRTAP